MIWDILQSMFLAAFPVFELRAGIPFAIWKGIDPWMAFLISVLANAIVAPMGFLFLDYVHHHLYPMAWYAKIFDRFVHRTRNKLHNKVTKLGYWSLVLFVGIPLPMTGAYTGTLGSWLFGLDRKKSLYCITLGVIMSGIIVTTVMISGSAAIRALFHIG